MSKYPQLAFKRVNGTQATSALAAKLVQESAFFQVTPFPGDDYEFAVKIDRESLLADQVGTNSNTRTYEDADLTVMDMAGLVAWYVQNVGYDPVEDDPTTELEELRARCAEMLEIDRAGGLDGVSISSNEDAGMNATQHQYDALEALNHLAIDIGMLASGDWVPDDAGCEASLSCVESARLYVSGSMEILLAAKKMALDVEEGACPKGAAKLLKEMMVRLGVWDGKTKDLDDE
jgi:hypothetical protein